MKILFVTAEPHPTFRADVRVLFGKYLPRHGVYSDLLTLPAGEQDQPWPAGQALLGQRPRNKWHKQWVQFWHDLSLFRRARQGYDAVQVRDRVLAGVLGLWAARRAGIPFFYWASYPKPEFRSHAAREQGLKGGVLKWLVNKIRGALAGWVLYRYLLPRSSHVFVQSDAMRTTFASRGVPLDLMTPVPMGVDMEEFEAMASQRPVDDVTKRLVYVGAMERLRQPELLLHAMPLVLARHPQAQLVMVGDSQLPGDLPALKALATELGVADQVQFTGWVSTSEAMAQIAGAAVGLSVFPRNGLLDVASPTKVPEYLAMGVPVVANDSPDQAYVIRASGGGLCAELDPAAFAAACCSLLDDPEAARRMGVAGRDFVRRERSYEHISEYLASAFSQLLKPCQPDAAR